MKSLVGKFGTLVLLAAVGGSAVVGCSSEIERRVPSEKSAGEGESGNVRLNLVPVPGITISSVDYKITGTPEPRDELVPTLPEGTLPTPGTAPNFGLGLSVPVGTGYVLSLTAKSDALGDDIRCTGASAPFDVEALQVVDFSLTLTCVDYSSGEAVVVVTVESQDCPTILPQYASAIPAVQQVGSNIITNALATDSSGKTITYAWSVAPVNGEVGHFTSATAQSATFVCDGPGTQVPLTVTFSNGDCDKELHTWVSCNSLTCGNEVLDEGEDCDPSIPADQPGGSPAGTTYGCPADCTVSCNDAFVEAPTEECNSGGVDGDTCTADCRNRVAVCGDGFITGAEVCDGTRFSPAKPEGTVCDPGCLTTTDPRCGDGVVSGIEECDPGETAGVTVGSQTCSNDCNIVATADCVACETDPALSSCGPFANACLNSPGTPTAVEQAQCFDVQECITDSNCGDGANAFTACYCGDLPTSTCNGAPYTGAGSPNGACRDIIRAAMGQSVSTPGQPATNAEILTRFLNRNFAAGAGINRYNCQKNDPDCRTVCGF